MKTFTSFYIWLIAFLGSIACGLILLYLNPIFCLLALASVIFFSLAIIANSYNFFSNTLALLVSFTITLLSILMMGFLFSQDPIMFINVLLSWVLGLLGFCCLVCWAVTDTEEEYWVGQGIAISER